MSRILITGSPGTSKSTVLRELQRLGHQVAETDDGGWCEWADVLPGWVWTEGRTGALAEHLDTAERLVRATTT